MNRLLIAAVFILSFANIAGAGDLKNPSLPPAVHYGEPLLFGQAHSNTPNNILNVMASPYYAKGDGVTDDLAAIQHAVYDACGLPNPPIGTPNTTATKAVYLPSPPVSYLHSAPIRIPCKSLEFYGSGGLSGASNLSQNYFGPAIIQKRWGNGGLATGPSLVAGAGAAATSTQSLPQPNVIDLGWMVNGKYTLPNQSANGFNIAFFINETSDSGGLALASSPSYPGTGNQCTGGVFCATFGGGGRQLTLTVLTSGGLVTIGACPAQTLSTTYEVEINWNKTTYQGWQGVPGGTAVACGTPQTSSDPPIQSPFEVTMMPPHGRTQFWPVAGQGGVDTGFIGSIDSVRFENGSVHTSAYTVPTTKFTADSNTFLLTNFEQPLDGTVLGYTGFFGGQKIYLQVTGSAVNSSIGYAAGGKIHDLELCGGAEQNSNGLWAEGANDSIWSNLTCGAAYYGAFVFTDSSFFAKAENLSSYEGHYGAVYGGAFNDSVAMNNTFDGDDVACVVHEGGGGGPFSDYSEKCVNRGNLYYGWIEDNSSANYFYPSIDMEAGATNFVASILLDQPLGYYFYGAGLAAANGTSFVVQDGVGLGSTFTGAHFGAVSATPNYIIDYTNGTPSSPTQLINTVNPSGVPLSNLLGYVSTNLTTTTALANFPTCNAARDGIAGYVATDATTCTTGSAIISGGSTYCAAICQNGVGWVH